MGRGPSSGSGPEFVEGKGGTRVRVRVRVRSVDGGGESGNG